jgi:NAD(P)-dependent dehydrogenase (short-subunit alcohol dehydrogenase family)
LNDLIVAAPNRVQVLQLDLEDQASIVHAGEQLRRNYQRVDLLLNVAGILGDGKTTSGPERSLSKLDREWFEKTLAVNLVGPAMLSKEIFPLLAQDRRQRKDVGAQRSPAIVANLSARVGSISDNGLGGWYSYRMSKSALNQFTRTMALELKRHSAWAIALHPGTTDTDLSVPFQANVKKESLFPVDFTASQLLNIVDSMTEEHSGGFYDWSGQSLSF